MADGLLVTFYSYKGGVGRSFALANVAVALASWGYRVLCIDWDLEAPGLGYYFKVVEPRPGLVELVLDATSPAPETPGATAIPVDQAERATSSADPEKGASFGWLGAPEAPVGLAKERWRGFVTEVRLESGVELDLIGAGRMDDQYISRLQTLEWDTLYEQRGLAQSMEDWRREWKARYDFVLIDSRTGVTDIGAICAAHLPDVLVVLFSSNDQSLDGCIKVIDRAIEARKRVPFERSALSVVPILSRFDGTVEHELGLKWLSLFESKTERFHAPWAEVGVSSTELIACMTIPYVPFWSFGEGLPMVDGGTRNHEVIWPSLETIAALVAHRLGNTTLLVKSAKSYVGAAARTGRSAGRYRYNLFVSSTPDLEDKAGELGSALERKGYRTVSTDQSTRAEPTSFKDFDRIMEEAQHGVFLIGRETCPRLDMELKRFASLLLEEDSSRAVLPITFFAEQAQQVPAVLRGAQIIVRPEDSIETLTNLVVKEINLFRRGATSQQPKGPEVELALSKLADTNPHIRAAAVATLGRVGGPEEFDHVVDKLCDDDRLVQEYAFKACQEMAKRDQKMDSRIVFKLAELLESGRPQVRQRAMEVLELVADARALHPLLRLCGRVFETDVRRGAAQILGRIGDARAVLRLIELLSDSDETVREAAADALGRIGSSEAFEWLCGVLYDPSPTAARAAARALLRLNNPALAVERFVALLIARGTAAVQLVAQSIKEAAGAHLVELLFDRIADPRLTKLLSDVAVELGAPLALDCLLRSFSSGDPSVRVAAARALGAIADPQAVKALLGGLSDDDASVRAAAVDVLVRMGGQPAEAAVRRGLDDLNPDIRLAAVRASIQVVGPDLVASLISRLRDESPEVKAAACDILGRRGAVRQGTREFTTGTGAVEGLAALFGPGDGAIEISQVVDPLVGSLQDADPRVRYAAVKALGSLRDRRAVAPLLRRLRDQDPDVKKLIVETLGHFGGPQVRDALLGMFSDDHPIVRAAVIETLVRLGEPETVPRVIERLVSNNARVRQTAVEALGQIGDRALVAELVKRIPFEGVQAVKAAIAEALGLLGGDHAAEALATLAADQDQVVRETASQALERVRRQ